MNRSKAGLVRRVLDKAIGRYATGTQQQLRRELDRNALLTARLLTQQLARAGTLASLHDAEFQVFSQFGEDGIIQYLIQRVPIENPAFIEFGVEDYSEANTRFLLVNNNWRGLIIDGGEALLKLRADPLYWRQEITAVQSFVTTENINALFENAGFRGDIGLLSVDIDGNDYWVWQAITAVAPRIVVCEYNSLFGNRFPVSVPYRPDFYRTQAHYSNLYFGASLPALCHLANAKGYAFVGTDSAGANAFFVRADLAASLAKPSVEESFVRSRFRSSRDEAGELTFLNQEQERALIGDLEVVDVANGGMRKVREL